MAEIILTSKNFKDEVINSDRPVLVDFWATWCGPCKMLAPTIEAIANEYSDVVKVGKVNVDDEPDLANLFRINAIPTVIMFKGGIPVSTAIGLRSKSELEQMINC